MSTITDSYNDFAFNLYNAISTQDNNVFVSPYSIVSALSMCFAGAKNNTEAQLKQLLSYTQHSNEAVHSGNSDLIKSLKSLNTNVQINVANKIFPKQGYQIKQQFTDILQKFYQSEIQAVNYDNPKEATQVINGWVDAQTKNKIKDLIAESHINSDTRLILVNAIYFKGSWLNKFDPAQTTKEQFRLNDGTTKTVDMMKILNKKYKLQLYRPDVKAALCEFPYAGEEIAMTIVLPHDNNIEEVQKQLKSSILKDFFQAHLPKVKVHAYIPKFKFEESIELSDVLKGMNAPDPFDQNKADFSGINEGKDGLHISKVVHKAVVEVNEEGTEAAAATGVVMMTRCAVMEPPPEEFRCDRPFLFVIHDKRTNTILFMGKYTKPQ